LTITYRQRSITGCHIGQGFAGVLRGTGRNFRGRPCCPS
jgi:hypothetical protein